MRAEAVREPALRARVEDDGALDDGRGHADEDATDFEDADGDALQDGAPVLGESRTRYSSATDVGRAPPEFLDQDRQARRGLLRRLWGYGCLLGLIALGLQLLYAYRVDIANSVPALRPALEAACRSMGCTVGYARRLERIAISASSLQPPPGAAAIDDGRSRLVLNLMLRNRYDKPQHWPALVLDLTDLSDTVVVRKVLRPEDYLTPEQLRGPFGPAGELKISVPIEVAGVQVNGYQLDKFFPKFFFKDDRHDEFGPGLRFDGFRHHRGIRGALQGAHPADRIHALSVSFLVPSMRKEYGGCSGNIAYSMQLLGGKPVPVATVGEDAGEYLERLQGLGIDVSRIKTIPETFTAQCFITTDLDDNQITAFHPGAMALPRRTT